MRKIKILIVLAICLIITACGGSTTNEISAKTKKQIFIVSQQKLTNLLSFNGIIQPIRTKIVTSPIIGRVEEMYFSYGQQVKTGQKLLKLQSNTLGKDYQQAVSAYLTAKEKYGNSKSNMAGAEELYKAGITSKQTFEGAHSELDDAYLSYLQAKETLIDLLKSSGLDQKSINLLEVENESAVKQAIAEPLKSITIFSPMNGIALKPTKTGGGDTGSGGEQGIQLGARLKEDQVIVEVGEMSGIKINLSVDEVSINKIKVGNQAMVTGSGFPGITLTGIVSAVSSQANSSTDSSSIPTFPVTVVVENITTEQQKLIHQGMSAKVKINIGSPEAITVPIKAVKVINNNTYVDLIDPKTGKTVQHQVQTGSTTLDGVQIIGGLKPGDKIVIGN